RIFTLIRAYDAAKGGNPPQRNFEIEKWNTQYRIELPGDVVHQTRLGLILASSNIKDRTYTPGTMSPSAYYIPRDDIEESLLSGPEHAALYGKGTPRHQLETRFHVPGRADLCILNHGHIRPPNAEWNGILAKAGAWKEDALGPNDPDKLH